MTPEGLRSETQVFIMDQEGKCPICRLESLRPSSYFDCQYGVRNYPCGREADVKCDDRDCGVSMCLDHARQCAREPHELVRGKHARGYIRDWSPGDPVDVID